MNPISQLLTLPKVNKPPSSERSLYIQDIADLTSMPFRVILNKTMHLKGEEGTGILKWMYDESLRYSYDKKKRAIKFWLLLRQTK